MFKTFKKNVPIPFKTIGFIPESHLETGNELTNFLTIEEEFIWKCNHNFGKIDFKKVNFRNHGEERYLDIDKNTKLFVRFFVSNDKEVGSIGLCFVFKDKPVLQIDTGSFNDIRSIKLSVSNTILHFIDGQFDICGQFGYDNGDRNFYFKKKDEKTGNIFLSHNILLKIVKKCFNILHDIADSNHHIFEEKEKAKKDKNKTKDIDIQNATDFIASE